MRSGAASPVRVRSKRDIASLKSCLSKICEEDVTQLKSGYRSHQLRLIKKAVIQFHINLCLRMDRQLEIEESVASKRFELEPVDDELKKRVSLLHDKVLQETKRLNEIRNLAPQSIEATLSECLVLTLPNVATPEQLADIPTKGDFERLRRVSKAMTKEVESMRESVPRRLKVASNLRHYIVEKEHKPRSVVEQILTTKGHSAVTHRKTYVHSVQSACAQGTRSSPTKTLRRKPY